MEWERNYTETKMNRNTTSPPTNSHMNWTGEKDGKPRPTIS